MSAKPRKPLPEKLFIHHANGMKEQLTHWGTTKQFPPALLLSGPSGIGKREMAKRLAQWILCIQSPFGRAPASGSKRFTPCGECPSCHKFVAGHHVDFTEILPEEKEEGRRGMIQIEALRDLRASQGLGATESLHRVSLIVEASALTPQASNAFLKLLEEPPPGWVFLLTTTEISLLLPTLLSRCQRLRLSPLPSEVLAEVLTELGHDQAKIQDALPKAMGSVGVAVQLLEKEDQERVQLFLKNPKAEWNSLLEWASTSHSKIQWLAAEIESWCSLEIVRLQSSLNASDSEIRKLLSIAEAVRKFRLRSHVPLNRKLQAQELLSVWTENPS